MQLYLPGFIGKRKGNEFKVKDSAQAGAGVRSNRPDPNRWWWCWCTPDLWPLHLRGCKDLVAVPSSPPLTNWQASTRLFFRFSGGDECKWMQTNWIFLAQCTNEQTERKDGPSRQHCDGHTIDLWLNTYIPERTRVLEKQNPVVR